MIPPYVKSLLAAGVFASATWGLPPLSVCEVLDRSRELRDAIVTVRGFLEWNSSHGPLLFATSDGKEAPCPGWPKHFFTAPSILALALRDADFPGPVLTAVRQRHSRGDYSLKEVVVVGRLRKRWLSLIFANRAGIYVGNGYGEGGGLAVLIEVDSIQELNSK